MELHYSDRGDGAPLLFLHGGTGQGDDWRYVFPTDPAGFRIIAPDLRGHGRSSTDNMYTIGDCAKDVLSLLDSLGLDRVKAIGFSLGAKTLLRAAIMQPPRFESMVLASAAPRFPEPVQQAAASVMPLLSTSSESLNVTRAQLATISARTLLVHGDRDQYYPVELALELYRGIPYSSLWVVPGADHAVMFGAYAPAFAAAAIRFLQA
jgi:pimeloyl-ACP methyl ester carboxylesterase